MNENLNSGDEWIGQMADALRNHSEPYPEGAWERFVTGAPGLFPEAATGAQPPATGGGGAIRWLPWKWGIAAAMVLLAGVSALWWGDWADDRPLDHRSVEEVSLVEVESSDRRSVNEVPLVEVESSDRRSIESPGSATNTSTRGATDVLVAGAESSDPPSAQATVLWERVRTQGVQPRDLQLATTPRDLPGLENETSLQQADPYAWLREGAETAAAGLGQSPLTTALGQTHRNTVSGRDALNKWDMGLVVASAMTTERLNLGGGISVAYRLSDRVSLRSGVSVGRYGVNMEGARLGGDYHASNGPQHAPVVHPSLDKNAEAIPVRYTRQLNSTTSRLLTMDIPVDVKYAWTGRFYTSVGLSFLGVLDEERTYHFIDRINEPAFAENASSGNDIQYSVRAFHVEERAAEQPLHGKGYAGFLNFSIGHRTPLTRKVHVSIEPFFKLPVGRLSHEDMNLTNGGVRIVTGF